MNSKFKIGRFIKNRLFTFLVKNYTCKTAESNDSPDVIKKQDSYTKGIFHSGGSAATSLILIGAVGSVGIMLQTSGNISERFNFLNVKKLKTEGQESNLYGLSVTNQMLKGTETRSPAVGLTNPVNPLTPNDIKLRYIEPNPGSHHVKLENDSKFIIKAPNLLAGASVGANSAPFSETVDVYVRAFDFEPFATGYGVKTLFVEADVQLANQKFSSVQKSRAKLSMMPPPGLCTIVAESNGVPINNGALLPFGSTANVNLRCKGVILSANIFNGGQLLSSAGPITQANDYEKVVSALLPPRLISGSQMHIISASASLVDGSPLSIDNFTLTIANPPPPPLPPPPLLPPAFQPPATPPPQNNVVAQPAPRPAPNSNPSPKNQEGLAILARAVDNREALAWNKSNAGPNVDMTVVTNKKMDFLAGPGEKVVGIKPPGGTGADRQYVKINVATGEMIPIGDRDSLGTGCIREGSLILTSHNTAAPIENLRVGDYVYNSKLKRFSLIKKVIAGPEKKPLVSIKTSATTVDLTETHPVVTPRGYVAARDIAAGKDTVWWNGDWHVVESVNLRYLSKAEKVWNLSLDGGDDWDEHLFEANGILVGDLKMQEAIEKQGFLYED